MVITIDGPAGAGKSTVARQLAEQIGFDFLDTGALYRAVALAGQLNGLDYEDPEQVDDLIARIDLKYSEGAVYIGGHDVSNRIRSPEITALSRQAADSAPIRQFLNDIQRAAARNGKIVTEGRDQGTVVFPNAEHKFFLTASPEVRARRRHQEHMNKGEDIAFEAVLAQQSERDERDRSRKLAPLRPAEDAIIIDTDGLSLMDVIERLRESIGECG